MVTSALMMSMTTDCMSIIFPYFMRSQNRTYATDTAKNAIVTAIQRTSCMGNLLLMRLTPFDTLTRKGGINSS